MIDDCTIEWSNEQNTVRLFVLESKHCNENASRSTDPSLRLVLGIISLRRHETGTAGQSQRSARRRRLRRCCRRSGVTALNYQSATPVQMILRCRRTVQDRRRWHILRVPRCEVETILAKDVAVRMATRRNWRACKTTTTVLKVRLSEWVEFNTPPDTI